MVKEVGPLLLPGRRLNHGSAASFGAEHEQGSFELECWTKQDDGNDARRADSSSVRQSPPIPFAVLTLPPVRGHGMGSSDAQRANVLGL